MTKLQHQQQQKNQENKVLTRAGKTNANNEEQQPSDEDHLSKSDINAQLADIRKTLNAINKVLERNTSEAKITNKSIQKLQNDIAKIDTNLSEMREEIDENKEKLEGMGKRMDCTDEKIEKQQKVIHEQAKLIKSQQIVINSLQQQHKSNQISIHNIPKQLNKQEVNKALSDWSQVDLSDRTIKKSSLVRSKTSSTATSYINFYSDSTKDQFMGFIKSKQRDANGKYVPITCEDVFDIPDNDPCRGIEINVRIVLSDTNKKIFNRARECKGIFNFVWLDMDGFIMIKEKKDDKAIRISSIEQLEEEINNRQQQIDES